MNYHVGSMTFDLECGLRLDGLWRMERAAIGTIEQNTFSFFSLFFLPEAVIECSFPSGSVFLSPSVCLCVCPCACLSLGAQRSTTSTSCGFALNAASRSFSAFYHSYGIHKFFQGTDEGSCCASWDSWGSSARRPQLNIYCSKSTAKTLKKVECYD